MPTDQAKDVDFNPWANPDSSAMENACSIAGEPDPPEGEEYEAETMYVAIDGVSMDDLSKPERESLERNVTDFMLGKLGKPIEGVHVGSIQVLNDGEV